MQAEALAIAKDAEADGLEARAAAATDGNEVSRLMDQARVARRSAGIMRSTSEVLRLEADALDD